MYLVSDNFLNHCIGQPNACSINNMSPDSVYALIIDDTKILHDVKLAQINLFSIYATLLTR